MLADVGEKLLHGPTSIRKVELLFLSCNRPLRHNNAIRLRGFTRAGMGVRRILTGGGDNYFNLPAFRKSRNA